MLGALILLAAAVAGGSALPRVTAVADGDTLRVSTGDRVRLVQIDAPELGQGECYAREAAAELRRLAPPGTRVLLEADTRLDRVDQHGRALRYVWKGDVNVNQKLVRRGAATVYFYRGDRGRYAARLLAVQAEARSARRGLWGACPRTRFDPGRGADTGWTRAPTRPRPRQGEASRRPLHPVPLDACTGNLRPRSVRSVNRAQ